MNGTDIDRNHREIQKQIRVPCWLLFWIYFISDMLREFV